MAYGKRWRWGLLLQAWILHNASLQVMVNLAFGRRGGAGSDGSGESNRYGDEKNITCTNITSKAVELRRFNMWIQ